MTDRKFTFAPTATAKEAVAVGANVNLRKNLSQRIGGLMSSSSETNDDLVHVNETNDECM
jgi:hypothetical protein